MLFDKYIFLKYKFGPAKIKQLDIQLVWLSIDII